MLLPPGHELVDMCTRLVLPIVPGDTCHPGVTLAAFLKPARAADCSVSTHIDPNLTYRERLACPLVRQSKP